MMDTDILLVFAELSIALAGFSAIIGVLGSRKVVADVRVNSLRIQVMLETCFMVAAAALVPALLSRFGIDAQVLWRISSALFLMVVIPFEFVARNRTKTLPNMTLTKFNINTVNWALSTSVERARELKMAAMGRFPLFRTLPPQRPLSGAKQMPNKNLPQPKSDRLLLP